MVKAYFKRSTTILLLFVMFFAVLLPISADAAVKISAPKQLFVDIGGTAQINVVTSPAADPTTLGLTYKSANENIATVDNTGLVSGIGKGSTTITVQYGKKSYKVTALVSEKGVPYTDGATFSIDYPQTWLVNENAPNLKVSFKSPGTSPNDLFSAVFGINVLGLNGLPYTLDDLSTLTISQYKLLFTDFKLLSNKKIRLSGYEAQSIIFTYRQGVYTIKLNAIYIVANDNAYVLCYGAEKSRSAIYSIELQKMVNSFKILG